MNSAQTPPKTFSDGLWIPAVIIFVSFVLSIGFMVNSINNYKKPKPLLIKPSSVETPEEIAKALYKALYPLKMRNFGVKILGTSKDPVIVSATLQIAKDFPKDKNTFEISAYKVSIKEDHDNDRMDCLNTALFNLKRKPEKKWKNKIYFTVCTEDTNRFSIFYTTK